jgi:hypothetical protein
VANTQAVQNKVNQIVELTARVQDNETDTNYQQLQGSVSELETMAREASQALLKDKCRPIMTKLENDVPLSEDEQKIVRLLLVGDADYYLESESNLDQWRDDVVRLTGEIGELQSSDLSEVDNLMRLQALCRDAMRVLPDMAYYFRQQERVRNFENTSGGPISSETKQVVADLIRSMLDSDKL